MNGFETKVSAITVVAGKVADWSGALLLAGGVIAEGSIERRVMQETGWDAVDCGRHGAPAAAPHLETSLACALESAKLHRPFSVIVQFTAQDGTRGGVTFHLQPCPFPRVTPDQKRSGFGFTCRPAG